MCWIAACVGFVLSVQRVRDGVFCVARAVCRGFCCWCFLFFGGVRYQRMPAIRHNPDMKTTFWRGIAKPRGPSGPPASDNFHPFSPLPRPGGRAGAGPARPRWGPGQRGILVENSKGVRGKGGESPSPREVIIISGLSHSSFTFM